MTLKITRICFGMIRGVNSVQKYEFWGFRLSWQTFYKCNSTFYIWLWYRTNVGYGKYLCFFYYQDNQIGGMFSRWGFGTFFGLLTELLMLHTQIYKWRQLNSFTTLVFEHSWLFWSSKKNKNLENISCVLLVEGVTANYANYPVVIF